MASRIQTFLDKIKSAVYGVEVRDAIHDSIKECYDNVTSGKTLADTAAAAANTAAKNADTATSNANAATQKANTAASNADTATKNTNDAIASADKATKAAKDATAAAETEIQNAKTATEGANASKKSCDDAVAALPGTITNLFATLGLALVDGKLCVAVTKQNS